MYLYMPFDPSQALQWLATDIWLQEFAPIQARLNGMDCGLVNYGTGNVASPPLGLSNSNFRRLKQSTQGDQPVSLRDDQFIGVDGRPFNIRGDLNSPPVVSWNFNCTNFISRLQLEEYYGIMIFDQVHVIVHVQVQHKWRWRPSLAWSRDWLVCFFAQALKSGLVSRFWFFLRFNRSSFRSSSAEAISFWESRLRIVILARVWHGTISFKVYYWQATFLLYKDLKWRVHRQSGGQLSWSKTYLNGKTYKCCSKTELY